MSDLLAAARHSQTPGGLPPSGGLSLEDKPAWCAAGAQAEVEFCQRLRKFGFGGGINIEKESDPFVHDLFLTLPSDLKSVRTPLFMARELYDLDPQYTVTFNVKDGQRYARLYPNILVVFDVRWDTLKWNHYEVEPMHRTYAGFLPDIRRAIKQSGSQRIKYQRRISDTAGNAKESFVFDVRCLSELAQPAVASNTGS